VKKKYDEAKERLENDVKEITELIKEREDAYQEFHDESAIKYNHVSGSSRKVVNKPKGILSWFS